MYLIFQSIKSSSSVKYSAYCPVNRSSRSKEIATLAIWPKDCPINYTFAISSNMLCVFELSLYSTSSKSLYPFPIGVMFTATLDIRVLGSHSYLQKTTKSFRKLSSSQLCLISLNRPENSYKILARCKKKTSFVVDSTWSAIERIASRVVLVLHTNTEYGLL